MKDKKFGTVKATTCRFGCNGTPEATIHIEADFGDSMTEVDEMIVLKDAKKLHRDLGKAIDYLSKKDKLRRV